MIFPNPPKLATASNVGKYVQAELFSWFRAVTSGLLRLDFVDNFSAFRVDDLVIPAGETAKITNALPATPTSRIIVRQTGNGLVTDGDWNTKTLSLVNNGAVSVTISIIFFS